MAQNLSNLPIGAKIKFGKHSVNGETAQPITWVIVAKNHSGYPANSVTCLAEKIIDLRCFDNTEPNNTNSDRKSNGNNDYAVSNISQWLNSQSSSWYTAAHSADQPPIAGYSSHGTEYSNRPGFLSNFTNGEIGSILNTSLEVMKYSYSSETMTCKLFIPSLTELGISFDMSDGTSWRYFENASSRRALLTSQCYNNTLSAYKPNTETSYWYWWTRTSRYETSYYTYTIDLDGNKGMTKACSGEMGVRPAMNLSSTLSISNTTDSDGYYTAIFNSAPSMPTTFNVPTAIYGGKQTTLSWSSVTDPDGNSVTYQLEQSLNGGAYTIIYSGTNLSYTTTIAFGTTNVQFRVKTVDSVGASSGYNSSTSRTVINNNAPTISDTNRNLGEQSIEFEQEYTISDSNENVVTVTEAIDGVRLRSYTTLGITTTFSVKGATWLTLANGSHTMTITATDGIDSTVRTYTFVKSVDSFTIQTTVAKSVSIRPTRIKLNIGREIPVGAIFKVEVCNNAFSSKKVWEDATSSVLGNANHQFNNQSNDGATNWGVLIRVTVERNNTSGACYVSSIGGNFE